MASIRQLLQTICGLALDFRGVLDFFGVPTYKEQDKVGMTFN